VVEDPVHAEKQHAREPGDLRRACEPDRPVSEGAKPNGGRERAAESDRCVVPVKQPNKEGRLLAEAVEGRQRPKDHDAQSSTSPTQSGERVSQGLSGVRRAARARKQEPFTALLHHVTVNLLRESFEALKKNAAPGVDGVTWREYETGLEDRLVDLHSRVHRGTYRAQPSRRVYIPKADGRQRPLGIAALEDKIVQQAVVTVLNEIYETDFRGFSYGFRPGRNPHQALDALNAGLQRKRVNWVLDADIKGFLDPASYCPLVTEEIRQLLHDFDSQAFTSSLSN
jgi:RNA-directed DNA polymerase